MAVAVGRVRYGQGSSSPRRSVARSVTGAAWAPGLSSLDVLLMVRVQRLSVAAAVLVGFELLAAPRQPLVLCSVDELTGAVADCRAASG